ncbi:hypothetical protein AURANDRAFT_62505 [Aureococcus anophagefferens]|uniref:Uncharacterized protein n=1 Tax=Aureococcus anophagefferens TaxID=44056 RepID=F0Y3S9_AURAN|nr:hypothetical protein AURANDRAFT_62505 [Aureococcus anophagefferens]EGB10004.1 hypothetical protein AURANDRAFT_62505 [Aureococcus anophagefferens]|eukprot:XP_009034848.1 hypothetical protein AURANDRAFT_62505 [Aureococcus anophagefferens]
MEDLTNQADAQMKEMEAMMKRMDARMGAMHQRQNKKYADAAEGFAARQAVSYKPQPRSALARAVADDADEDPLPALALAPALAAGGRPTAAAAARARAAAAARRRRLPEEFDVTTASEAESDAPAPRPKPDVVRRVRRAAAARRAAKLAAPSDGDASDASAARGERDDASNAPSVVPSAAAVGRARAAAAERKRRAASHDWNAPPAAPERAPPEPAAAPRTPGEADVAATRAMWPRTKEGRPSMYLDGDSSDGDGVVPPRPPRRRDRDKAARKSRRAERRKARGARAEELDDEGTESKHALRDAVRAAAARDATGGLARALDSATADAAKARGVKEKLRAFELRQLRRAPGEARDAGDAARREAAVADAATARAHADADLRAAFKRASRIRKQIIAKASRDDEGAAGPPRSKARRRRRAASPPPGDAKPRGPKPDAALLKEEVLLFFENEPVAEQLQLIRFALKPENRRDLPAIAVAFQFAYEGTRLVRDLPSFDDECLVVLLVCDLRETYVAYLRPVAVLLHVLLDRPANLRRALKAGAVAAIFARLQGELEPPPGPPTPKSRALDACRALLAALLFRGQPEPVLPPEPPPRSPPPGAALDPDRATG